MSLITRCPACETMFKVVPDQLRISQGWARCGQCGEVFDASQQLVADLPTDTPDSAPPAPPAAPAPAPEIAAPLRAPPDLLLPDQSLSAPPSESGDPAWAQTDPPDAPLPQAAADLQSAVSFAAAATAIATPAAAAETGFVPTQAEGETPDLSFMRDGNKRSIWRKPAVRVVLLLLVLALVAALAAQILRQERDRVVLIQPSARPLLAALCAWSGCELGPVRQIESIVIESSSFTRVRGENYRLAFSLKNNAPFHLAMPAIELALTDAQDQAVLRRVIAPPEFGAASRLLAAGSDWNSSLSLNVKAPDGSDRIAGYRLLAFYP